MRTLSALLLCLSLSLALAGCFGGDDEDGGDGGNGDPTTPTDVTTPTNVTTPTRPTNATPTAPTSPTNTTDGGNETTAPAPKEAGSGTASFASAEPPAPVTVTIDPGYTRVNFTVTWAEAAPVSGVLQEITVTFTDAGGAALSCSLPAGPVSPATPVAAPCVKEGPVAPGDATVSFEGAGGITADWTVNVS